MRRHGFLCLLCALLLVSFTSGRVAPPIGSLPESVRMKKLKQLSFDRRPSAILKAWAPQPPDDPTMKKGKRTLLDAEIQAFQLNVTLGKWDAVKAYLAGLPADEGKTGYEQLLQSLQNGPSADPGDAAGRGRAPRMNPATTRGPMTQYAERNRFAPEDVVGLAAAAPKGLDKEHLEPLSAILSTCLSGGVVVEAVVARLQVETTRPKGALTPRQAAQILAGASQAADAAVFLPNLGKAQADKDLEGLNLLARHFIGLHDRDSKLHHLEQAWSATQSVLAQPTTTKQRAEQEEALRRAVELAPRLKEALGQVWLQQSFTLKPERGMSILAAIGTLSSQGLQSQPHNPGGRLTTLKLQKTAVEALLKGAPNRAKEWGDTLTLLANNWLREAEYSQQMAQTRRPQMRRDRFGNTYFYGGDDPYNRSMMMMRQNQNQPQPIDSEEMLTSRPEKAWREQLPDSVRPKVWTTLCQLYLKVEDETKAFPFIEQLAGIHAPNARELANEFLQVWTRNHDPNGDRGYRSRYMFFYGFEERADGIPLTRSKQERNLIDLAGWVERLRKLHLEKEVDEELLAKAFTTCHSSAEVYRSEAIEKVFGPLGGLKPKTLSGLAQQMRENLAGVWRKPEEQKSKKTNRKTKDIQAEVKRGYDVARATVENALKKFPDDWSLVLARAALLHDAISFEQALGKSTTFAAKRNEAFTEFARAAKLYASKVKDLSEEEQSTKVFEQWFYASLGACDLAGVDEEKVPDLHQPELVRQALLALPGETAEKHREKFASSLFSRMSGVKPAVKYRYLQGGFAIIGDHPQAAEAKKVFDYYKDVVREIKLETKVDGSSTVGHNQPFGVFVFLRHTRDIERESGGFGRYLQNQNSNTAFSWNYGRPTTDYRDRFQTAATEALKEHFDVVSVTFETDKVHSRATEEYGWRVTPYAYLLLKARGPQVDKLPPLRIDLDFLDTSGYAVLPVESPAVPLDARPASGAPRPAKNVQITQTLDERQADKGKLLLEIKATAHGLVPELDRIAHLAPPGFDVVKTDDQGVSVARFEEDADTITISSERTWMVTLQGRESAARPPEKFAFASAKDNDAKMEYQRFSDADLVKVDSEIALEGQYGRQRLASWWVAGAAAGVAVLALIALIVRRRPRADAAARWSVPERLSPFTTIALLENIQQEGTLTEEQRVQLRESIHQVERSYFAGESNGHGKVDLKAMAKGWVQRVR